MSELSQGEYDHAVALSAQIGLALSEWALVEMSLYVLFDATIGTADRKQTRAIFSTIVDFRTRLAIVDNLMSLEEIGPVERKMWEKMSARINKFYKRRHHLAHGITRMKDGQMVLMPLPTPDNLATEDYAVLTLEDIQVRRQRFNDISEALAWFIHHADIRRNRGELSHPLPDPEPSLIAQLRNLATRSPEDSGELPLSS